VESTTEGPLSYVLPESPFASVSKVNRGHPSLVSLLYTPCSAVIFQIYAVNSSITNNEIQLHNRNKDASEKNVCLYIVFFIFTPSSTRMKKDIIVFYVKSTGQQLNAPASVRICECRGGGGLKDDTFANCNEANRLATI
jgi:hypothetical protein